MTSALPLLYSFKRCPYAMRARMALAISGIEYTRIEVDLKHKPPAMLVISPKGTVPVLQLPDGRVIEESLDIMRYALELNDPAKWLPAPGKMEKETHRLIEQNDTVFKKLLDKFKYHARHTEATQDEHQINGEAILAGLESRLEHHAHLLSDNNTLADAALFPFIRQWAGVKPGALDRFPRLKAWLEHHTASALFKSVMQ